MAIGFLNLLTIIFVIGKLLGFVSFSWLIVFLPTLISLILTIILVIVALILSIYTAVK